MYIQLKWQDAPPSPSKTMKKGGLHIVKSIRSAFCMSTGPRFGTLRPIGGVNVSQPLKKQKL